MYKIFANSIKKSALVVAIVFLAGVLSAEAKVTNVTINNNVRSGANSGGNSGGNISTGSASAKTNVKNEVSGSSGETKIKTNASAEANGKKVEVNSESSGGEDQNIQKEVSEDGSSASVEVQSSHAEQKTEEPTVEEGIFTKVTDAFGTLFRKLFSIFN